MSDTSTRYAKLTDVRERFRELWSCRLDLFLACCPSPDDPLDPDALEELNPLRESRKPVTDVIQRGEPCWRLMAFGDRDAWDAYALLSCDACLMVPKRNWPTDIIDREFTICIPHQWALLWTIVLAGNCTAAPLASPLHVDKLTWEVLDGKPRFSSFDPGFDLPTGKPNRWCVELPGAFRRSELLLAELAGGEQLRAEGGDPDIDALQRLGRRYVNAWALWEYARRVWRDIPPEPEGEALAYQRLKDHGAPDGLKLPLSPDAFRRYLRDCRRKLYGPASARKAPGRSVARAADLNPEDVPAFRQD